MEKTRCMLREANLGQNFWAEAVNTAVYLKNRSPTLAVRGCTPEEKWMNKKVSISHLRTFGCIAYVHINTSKRNKLQAKAKKYIFVGYCEDTKGYRLLDPDNPRDCTKARDVSFLEDRFINVSNDDNNHKESFKRVTFNLNDKEPPKESSTEENISVTVNSDDTSLIQLEPRYSVISVHDSDSEESFYSNDTADKIYVPEEEESSSSSYAEEEMNSDSMLSYMVNEMSRTTDGDEPQTVKEALSGPEADNWKKSMQDEYNSFLVNKCWTLTDRISGRTPEVIEIKKKLNSEFEITDLGPARHVLGMRICKLKDKITLDQTNYIEKVLQRFKIEDCKPAVTPMETGIKLEKSLNDESDEHVKVLEPYASIPEASPPYLYLFIYEGKSYLPTIYKLVTSKDVIRKIFSSEAI
ncbi:uncharacterized protein [Epargyreus clarus]|uniref:uncharacterized protein n=1 Tax=Epargyreus clarus TaxID=520877 RepID=UPI003C2EE31C